MPKNSFEPLKAMEVRDRIAALEVPTAVLALLPESIARQHGVLPVAHLDGTLYCFIAAESFENEHQIGELMRSCFDGQVYYATIPQAVIQAAIERHYSRLDPVVFEIAAKHIWVLGP